MVVPPHAPAAAATDHSHSRDPLPTLPLFRIAEEGAEQREAGKGRAIADEIIRQTAACGTARSICPSEVARALDPDWRPLMGPVRRAAAQLADAGRIDILRKGKPITPAAMRGVIRLRLRPATSDRVPE